MKPRLNSIVKRLGWGVVAFGGVSGLVLAADVTLSNGNSCTYTSMSVDPNGNVNVNCSAPGGSSPTVSILSPAAVTEGQPRIVTIQRNTTSGSASVTVEVNGGTATPGTDYTAFTDTTVTFADGQNTKTVTLTTLEDGEVEGTETISLILSNPVGAALGTSTAVVSITDNDTQTGSCPGTFPANRIQAAGWFVNSVPSGTVNLPSPAGIAAVSGEPWAQQFTISAAKPHLMLNVGYSTQLGGTASKEITISSCPGDFSSSIPAACRRMLTSSQSSSIYIYSGSAAYCNLAPGTYYLNIRATGSAAASGIVTATQLP